MAREIGRSDHIQASSRRHFHYLILGESVSILSTYQFVIYLMYTSNFFFGWSKAQPCETVARLYWWGIESCG